MSVSPCLNIYSVTTAKMSWNSISVLIKIGLSKQNIETLINSGTGGIFIDQNHARNFEIQHLDKLVKAYNVDGTENKKGMIKSYMDLEFQLGDWLCKEKCYITGLGRQKIILGFPWLYKYNPSINWKKGEIAWKPYQIDWKCLYAKGQKIRRNNSNQRLKLLKMKKKKRTILLSWWKKMETKYLLNYWKLTYGFTKWTLQWNLLSKRITRKATKLTKNWYQKNIMDILTSSAKKRLTDFLNHDLGTTKSKWRKDLNLNHLKTI
jgi:hypothetical protein